VTSVLINETVPLFLKIQPIVARLVNEANAQRQDGLFNRLRVSKFSVTL